jgi:uncharacterized HAD superfamily protein
MLYNRFARKNKTNKDRKQKLTQRRTHDRMIYDTSVRYGLTFQTCPIFERNLRPFSTILRGKKALCGRRISCLFDIMRRWLTLYCTRHHIRALL